MKKLISISVFISMMLSSLVMYSQKDSISLQREARKLVREGNKLYNQKKYADATISYKKALEKNSSYTKATYNLGNSLFQEKNFKEAIPQYKILTENSEDSFEKAEGYHNIGNAMMEEKNYQGAVDAYKNSLRKNPNDDETRYNLAIAQKLLEKEKNKDKEKTKTRTKTRTRQDKRQGQGQGQKRGRR